MYQNTVIKFIFCAIAGIILVMYMYVTYTDFNYLLTRKYALARIVSINANDNTELAVRVSYPNEYSGTKTISVLDLNRRHQSELEGLYEKGQTIEISYSKYFKQNVYIKKYKNPGIGLLFFDLSIVIIMSLAFYLNLPYLKKT